MEDTVLEVKNLKIGIRGRKGISYPVENVNFEIRKGETFALVGESGSGKSMTALSVMGLLSSWSSYLDTEISGNIVFTDKQGIRHELTELGEKEYDRLRGNDLSMIFQEPLTALNPVISVGKQIMEVLLIHNKMTHKEAKERAIELLNEVEIPNAEERFQCFPHQFSGGQLQRIMIAIAIACNPACLIADEPTTALDVTVQKQILELLKKIQRENHMSIFIITHDLAVVSEFADTVAVMYSGNIVEYGTVEQIFHNPDHPYTELLLRSIPTMDTVPGTPLLTKRDFLYSSDVGTMRKFFDPYCRGRITFRKVGENHYVSTAFVQGGAA